MTQAIRYEIPEYLVRRQVAKRSERLVQLAALAGAAACIFVASLLVTPINTIRTEILFSRLPIHQLSRKHKTDIRIHRRDAKGL